MTQHQRVRVHLVKAKKSLVGNCESSGKYFRPRLANSTDSGIYYRLIQETEDFIMAMCGCPDCTGVDVLAEVVEAPVCVIQPELAVWYGPMPESNGKSNFTALLHRKGESLWDGVTITLDRSEYPERVRYEADRVRYLIGEIKDEPSILDYDADKHSGYVRPAVDAQGTKPALVQVCKLGILGQAYDAPDTHRAYTYANQPGNVVAYRLAKVLVATGRDSHGDGIDQGLSLLHRLQEVGFGVFELAASPSTAGADIGLVKALEMVVRDAVADDMDPWFANAKAALAARRAQEAE